MSPDAFHPDLQRAARLLPRRGAIAMLRLSGLPAYVSNRRGGRGIERVHVGDTTVRLHLPEQQPEPRGALVWLHGGGYVGGYAGMDDRLCQEFARELGIAVAAVDYRLAPTHPFPAGLDDAHAVLRWLAGQPYVDRSRVAVGGASAGGGLAAALALAARDRGEVAVAFQLLSYPMLDDRTVTREADASVLRLWDTRANAYGWRSYLGVEPGSAEVSGLAAPGRCTDLAGLPPAWIGVGTCDLFHDEDVAYAERLRATGIPCQTEVVEGAFHGFDRVCPRAAVSRRYRSAQVDALRRGLSRRAWAPKWQ